MVPSPVAEALTEGTPAASPGSDAQQQQHGQDSRLGRTDALEDPRITHTMQVPLIYAKYLIGIAGANVALIHRTSGANITVFGTRDIPEEITVEIKGTYSQIQNAILLVQDSINAQREYYAR